MALTPDEITALDAEHVWHPYGGFPATTEPLVVASDEDGRFSFDAVDRGLASLVVRRADEAVAADGGAGAVSTPVIEI